MPELDFSWTWFANELHPSDRHWLFDEGGCALPDVFFFRLPQHFFLDFHVSEFVRVEYLATIQTFDVFDVLFTRYDAHFGVFAGGVHLGGLSVQPVLLGKIVPAGFRLSNLFLCFRCREANFSSNLTAFS